MSGEKRMCHGRGYYPTLAWGRWVKSAKIAAGYFLTASQKKHYCFNLLAGPLLRIFWLERGEVRRNCSKLLTGVCNVYSLQNVSHHNRVHALNSIGLLWLLNQIFSNNKVKEDGMGSTCIQNFNRKTQRVERIWKMWLVWYDDEIDVKKQSVRRWTAWPVWFRWPVLVSWVMILGFVKCRGFFDLLRHCRLLKKDFIAWT